jgi:hypothetical protein
MAIDFPDSPATNDSFTSGGKKWIFNGTTWNLITANSYTISTGEVTAAKIASNAVTEAKINAGAVTQAKLASGLSGITVTTTANRSAVIPSPFTGQFIFLTDTSSLQRWDGSTWVVAIPTAPTGAPTSVAVSGSPTSSTVTLTFTPGATGGSDITNYQYALSTNGGTTYGSYTSLATPDATSPITITGLTVGTTYYVKLKAVNNVGASASESSAVSFTTANLSIEYLVVAGGGGGGAHVAGGGGAGGYRSSVSGEASGANSAIESALSVPAGTYTVTIGAGGNRARNNGGYAYSGDDAPSNGNNTVFSTITSTGGGRGGCWTNLAAGSGGSGGGRGGTSGGAPGTGTAGQGFSAVVLTDYGSYQETGGAGAGGANTAGGTGGIGISSSITGTATFRAGGGGAGAHDSNVRSPGGNGGGGLGSRNNENNAVAGTANTGGGGGGGGGNGGIVSFGANGGSGVVIVRYLTADASGSTITGGTATTSGSYTVRTFTASGSLVIA